MSLDPREIEVLRIIVHAFIESATPVGSRYVAKKSALNLSPASMRNIMADLTEKGYLTQPHTSAGRIPTSKAFRYYLEAIFRPAMLSPGSREKIKGSLSEAGLGFTDILEHASKLISNHSSQVGMAVAPRRSTVRFHQIDFALVRPGLVMAIMILQGGIVQNRLLTVEKKVETDDLIKFSNYLNEKFQGRTLLEVKERIIQEMKQAENQFNAMYYRALDLARNAVNTPQTEREIFVEGMIHVLNRGEQVDFASMRELLEFLEQRSNLLEILDKISESEGLIVSFGTEFYGPELESWSLISSPYTYKGQPLGLVGTIGPIHMDYAKMVPMVDYVAKMLTDILETRF